MPPPYSQLAMLVVNGHRTRVEARIAEWSQALELIDQKIDFYGQWLATGRRPKIALSAKLQKRQTKRGNA
jgi:hypothetical protein